MFNRIKEAAQEAKNKFVDGIEGENEGQFQCPNCMRRFGDPEVLIQHHTNCSAVPPQSHPPNSSVPPTDDRLQVQTLEKEKTQLWAEVSSLKKENSELKKKLGEGNKTQDVLYQQKTQIFNQNKKLEMELEALKSTSLSFEKALEQNQEIIAKLHGEVNNAGDEILELKTENKQLQSRVTDLVLNQEITEKTNAQNLSIIAAKSDEITNLQKLLTDRNGKISACIKNEKELKKEIDQHADRYKQLESHQVKDDSDLIRSLTEAEEKIRKLTDALSASKENQKEIEYLRREVDQLNNRNLGLENSNQKLILEIDKNDKIIRKLENEKDDICAELVTLSDVASKFTEFEKRSESTKFENESKIQDLTEQNCKLEKELTEALQKNEAKLKEFANSEINMNKNLSDSNAKLNHFKTENERLKLELNSAETMMAELLNQQEILEKDAAKSRQSIENLQALHEKKIEEIQVFKEDIDKYSQLYNKNKNNIKELKEFNGSLQAQMTDQSAQNKILSDQLHTAQANLKGMAKARDSLVSEVETLSKTRDNLLVQSERLVIQVSTLDKEILERRDKELKNKNKIQQLEQLKQSAIQRENEKHEKLQLQIAKHEELRNELRLTKDRENEFSRIQQIKEEENENLKQKVQQCQIQINQLKLNNKDIEKKFASVSKESQDMELERQDLKNENKKLSEQMSDYQTTIKDLGKSLAETQIAWEAEKSRRWVDDDSVSSCPGCSVEFTTFVRRHHCRKCGGIFCYNCSNFTLVLPSSSKPQRVCQACL